MEIATGISTNDYIDHVYTSMINPNDTVPGPSRQNETGPSPTSETPPIEKVDYLNPIKAPIPSKSEQFDMEALREVAR